MKTSISRKILKITLAVVVGVLLLGIGSLVGRGQTTADTSAEVKPVAAAPPTTITVTQTATPSATTITAPAPPPVTVTYTPPKPAGISEGIYAVGSDIEPGRYKTDGAGSCYFARLKDDSGSFNAIIANNNLSGPGSVSLKKGEYFETKGACTWVKVP